MIPTGSQGGFKRERRRFTRIQPRQLRGSMFTHGADSADVWVVDISLGGALLKTLRPLPIAEPLALELPRAGRSMLRLQGRVVSSRQMEGPKHRPGVGVRFDALDPLLLGELRELIRSFAPSQALELPEADETTVAGPGTSGPRSVPTVTATEPLWAAPPVPKVEMHGDEVTRLRTHVKGLLFQIGEMANQLDARNRELEVLREAIRRLQATNAMLERRDRSQRN